jgi:hypothetical protein
MENPHLARSKRGSKPLAIHMVEREFRPSTVELYMTLMTHIIDYVIKCMYANSNLNSFSLILSLRP